MRAVFLALRAAASMPRATASESLFCSAVRFRFFMDPRLLIVADLPNYRRPTTGPPAADKALENSPNCAETGAVRRPSAHHVHPDELSPRFDSKQCAETATSGR